MGLIISDPRDLESHVYSPEIMKDLLLVEEWKELEHWMGVSWMRWPLEDSGMTEDMTLPLFHRRPSATQQLREQ